MSDVPGVAIERDTIMRCFRVRMEGHTREEVHVEVVFADNGNLEVKVAHPRAPRGVGFRLYGPDGLAGIWPGGGKDDGA